MFATIELFLQQMAQKRINSNPYNAYDSCTRKLINIGVAKIPEQCNKTKDTVTKQKILLHTGHSMNLDTLIATLSFCHKQLYFGIHIQG